MKSQKVKLYSISNQIIEITLVEKRKAFDGNTVLKIGKCKINCNDLYINSIYSKHPYPKKFIKIPKSKTISISWLINQLDDEIF